VDLADEEERQLARFPGRYPHYSTNGQWHRVPIDETSGWVDDSFYDHGNWTAGFSVGLAWLRRLGDLGDPPSPAMRNALSDIGTRATDETTHDLGFLFYPSFSLGQMLGSLSAEDAAPASDAARVLGSRFNGSGQFIQAFGAKTDPRSAGTSTIDTMMNLPLLWWASKQYEKDSGLFDIARRHAVTSARNFFREDGSTFHLIRFDTKTGALLERGTFQGASAASCWSRGQAWAIAGFAWAFGATGDEMFSDAAERAWKYFEERIPSNGVVPWDFGDMSQDAVSDASASAAAALGALLLSQRHPSERLRGECRAAAVAILEALHANAVRQDDQSQGILLRSCYSKPHDLGVRGATPYGDFYYGLALALATGRLHASDLFAAPLPQRA
jgi:unsaturated chondroitin disaccharide hydrolase